MCHTCCTWLMGLLALFSFQPPSSWKIIVSKRNEGRYQFLAEPLQLSLSLSVSDLYADAHDENLALLTFLGLFVQSAIKWNSQRASAIVFFKISAPVRWKWFAFPSVLRVLSSVPSSISKYSFTLNCTEGTCTSPLAEAGVSSRQTFQLISI